MSERVGLGRARASRELQRVLAAAEAMAKELRRRELGGDVVAAELCELYEQAIGAFDRQRGTSYTTDLRPVAEALPLLLEGRDLTSELRAVEGVIVAIVRRVRRRFVQVLAMTRSTPL